MRLRDSVRILCFWVRRLCRMLESVLYGLSENGCSVLIISPSRTRVYKTRVTCIFTNTRETNVK